MIDYLAQWTYRSWLDVILPYISQSKSVKCDKSQNVSIFLLNTQQDPFRILIIHVFFKN